MRRRRMLALLVLLGPLLAQAEIRVDVRKGADSGIPIAVVPVGKASRELADVARWDLSFSPTFEVLRPGKMPQAVLSGHAPDWNAWRRSPVEYLLTVQREALGNGRVGLKFHLLDVLRGRTILARRLEVAQHFRRRLAHQTADAVHQHLLGVPGAFDTRMAYISQSGRGRKARYRLYVSDIDGHRPVAILASPHPLLSPDWSPDGKQLAYVSFELGHAQVYVHHLRKGTRRALPYAGAHSSAPDWSPDGRQLAMAMSIEGDTEIFVYTLATGSLRRVTHSRGIDTEPVWEADGRTLVFTSGRSGQPRLYRKTVGGMPASALPIAGRYSASADASPDGRHLAFVQSTAPGGFGIALYETASEVVHPLSSGGLDEAPSFAPNGLGLLYANTVRGGRPGGKAGKQVLTRISRDGTIQRQLDIPQANVREPAWSPYRH